MDVSITTSECAWSHFEINFLNRTIKGLLGFEFKKTKEKEGLYGGGDDPMDIMEGQKAYTGNLKVLGFEADMMNKAADDAGYEDITEVPHDQIVITCSFRRRVTDPIKTYVARGVGFTELTGSMERNAKHREVTLPFLALSIKQPKSSI